MKCVQNKITGEVRRVNDDQAVQMCGGIFQNDRVKWAYVPKSYYKGQQKSIALKKQEV